MSRRCDSHCIVFQRSVLCTTEPFQKKEKEKKRPGAGGGQGGHPGQAEEGAGGDRDGHLDQQDPEDQAAQEFLPGGGQGEGGEVQC